ncbi:MAG: hypothetical protein EXR75_10520 [Myxococcales bacterium]|nr:hypothetical protein [Myxococcales bacterium]
MSEPDEERDALRAEDEADASRADDEPLDDIDVRSLLRRALDSDVKHAPPKGVVRKVQERLRAETRGRYFADGWGTSSAPRETYLATSLIMLVLLALTWWLLGPYDLH